MAKQTNTVTNVAQLSAQDIRKLAMQLRSTDAPATPSTSVLMDVAVGFSNLKGAFAQARDAYVVAEHLRKQ